MQPERPRRSRGLGTQPTGPRSPQTPKQLRGEANYWNVLKELFRLIRPNAQNLFLTFLLMYIVARILEVFKISNSLTEFFLDFGSFAIIVLALSLSDLFEEKNVSKELKKAWRVFLLISCVFLIYGGLVTGGTLGFVGVVFFSISAIFILSEILKQKKE